jgi:SecD/SecF fusion protein
MTEKNVGQRLIVTAIAILIGAVLLWPPGQKLRPGLDIAGGTSLIFEVDTSQAGGDVQLAERVKALLQKRVDPAGIYNLAWRVQGRNRLEVQMPLPPKDALARRQAYAAALDNLYSCELRRGATEAALRLAGADRETALKKLAGGRADEAFAELKGDGETRRAAIEKVIENRAQLLFALRDRYDAYRAAETAHAAGPTATQPAPTDSQSATAPASQPNTQAQLDEALRDAAELFEEAIQEVLTTNLNRARFEEVLDLETTSKVRKTSLEQLLDKHADLRDKLEAVLEKYAAYRTGKQFLDGPADLKRLLRGSGKLEFRILAEPDPANPTKYDRYREQLREGRKVKAGDEFGWFPIDNPLQFFNLDSPAALEALRPESDPLHVVAKSEEHYYVLGKTSADDGLLQGSESQRKWRLNRARPDRDENGRLSVAFELDVVGGQIFESLTGRNLEKQLCILVDDVAYSSARIQSRIRQHGQITGEFSADKISYLVQTMEGGTLPARLKDTPLSERTIGSSLGEMNRDLAVKAGLYGMIAVALLMVVYYFVCGAVANLAMLLNVFLTLAVLAMLGARITLDGIAGLILSVGIAVDANVLIYERMREEKERGASLRMIIRNGYDRAFSTIFDSNMTTILTCVIIYYVGSEEIKGFGLTLGWGVALNLFTAVFVTRALFDFMLRHNLIKDIKSMHLFGRPSIEWYSKAKFLVPVTVTVTLIGVMLLFVRGKQNIFDIEFLGGIAAEFEVQEPKAGQSPLNDVTIGKRLTSVANELAADAGRLAQATVTAVESEAGVFDVRLQGTDAERLAALLAEPLEAENVLAREGVKVQAGSPALRLVVQGEITADQLADKIHALAAPAKQVAENLKLANINAVLEAAEAAESGHIWNVTTTATNMRLTKYALLKALGDEMRTQPTVEYVFRGDGDRPYPVTDRLLNGVVPGLPAGISGDVTDYFGGAAMYLDQLNPPLTAAELKQRLDNMLFQPDFANMPRRPFTVIGVTPAAGTPADPENPPYTGLVVVTGDSEIRYQDDEQAWLTGLVQPQMKLVTSALTNEQSLRKVMQFKPQIAAQATEQASLALVLAWAMIVAYVWIRFGRLSFGLGAVIALVHDVLLALAFVGFSGWIASTSFGRMFLVEDFKINMPIIAALLTVVGYSVNDTIVVFDRIRETRGRLGRVTVEIVNNSINQTLSRTIMTVFTVFVVIVIMYIFGGSSIRGFSYCMLIGVLTGCYSSIAIASPLLLLMRSRREVAAQGA